MAHMQVVGVLVHSATCVWIALSFHSPLTAPLPYPTCLPPTPPFPLPCSPLPPSRPREALSSVQGSMASMVSHSSVQAAGMQQLQERLGQVQAGQYGWEEGWGGGAERRGWEEGLRGGAGRRG